MAPEIPPSRPAPPQKGGGPSGKITNRLVALGSAAVLTVYAAGYARTRTAAERFVVEAADLRGGAPLDLSAPVVAAPPPAEAADVAKTPAPSAPAESAASVARSGQVPRTVAHHDSGIAPRPRQRSSTPAASGAASPRPPRPPTRLRGNTPATETPATPAAPENPAPVAPPTSVYRDGRYLGWGYSRHGDIEADIVILDGRIVSTQITQCLTRYSCDVIAQSPGQVLERQSPYIDIVGGATESANAYANAVYRAMKAAKN